MKETYPDSHDPFLKFGSPAADEAIGFIKAVVTAIRNIRGENRISPASKIKVRVACENSTVLQILKSNEDFILSLARLENVDFSSSAGQTKKSAMSLVTIGRERIHVV